MIVKTLPNNRLQHYSQRIFPIHILQVVVSGSRDRGINLWSMAEVRDKGAVRPTLKVPDAHKGESLDNVQ